MDRPAIEIEGLRKAYGDLQAVDGLDLTVPEGIVFALLGPNGAGKTTTVEILEGLRRPTAGRASVLGHDVVREYDRVRSRVGILPQDFSPFDRLTPREHLRYFAALFGRGASAEELEAILELVRLPERADVQARHLSGGEKRKLGIALALVGDPTLVFLDEPTTGLDPSARRDLWRIVEGLREKGRTVVLTTHYIEEAEALADDVAIMVRGRVVAEGPPGALVDAHGEGRRLRLVGAGEAGAEVLSRNGWKVLPDGEDLVVRVPNGRGVGEVLTELARRGVPLEDLEIARPRLEDVFLKLVGARLEEGELRA